MSLLLYSSEQWLFLLCYSLEKMFFEDTMDNMQGDRVGEYEIDVFCCLNSIGDLFCNDLYNDRMLRGGRKLGWVTRVR